MKQPLTTVAATVLAFSVACWAPATEPTADDPRLPANGSRLMANVCRLMAHGEFEQARDAILKQLAEAPDENIEHRAEATFLLGRAHEVLGNKRDALNSYRAVVNEFPTSTVCANACLALAQLYIYDRQPKKAVSALEAALSRTLSPAHDFRATLLLAEVISIPGSEIEDQDRALALFQALDDKAGKPNDVARLNYGIGFCYQRKGDLKQAEEHYIAVVKTAPHSLWAAYANMQRLAYYRRQRLRKDALRIEKQLGRQRLALAALGQIEPRAPNLPAQTEDETHVQPERSGDLLLPRNAVLTHKGYTITAGRFSLNPPQRILTGHDGALLVLQTKTSRTKICGESVRIDLRLRRAIFAGDVTFETSPKTRDYADLQEVTVYLDTGRCLFHPPQLQR